jgi:hypothetical protein
MWTILLIGYFLTWSLVRRILLAKKRPVSALAWTWSIILFPYLRPLAYFVFGIERITRKWLELRVDFGLSKLADPGVDEDARKVSARIGELTAEQRRTVQALSRINELAPSTAEFARLTRVGAPSAEFHHMHARDRSRTTGTVKTATAKSRRASGIKYLLRSGQSVER